MLNKYAHTHVYIYIYIYIYNTEEFGIYGAYT